MDWIKREIENQFADKLQPGKVLVVHGARRVGKTSAIERLVKNTGGTYFIGTGDDIQTRDILSSENKAHITSSFSGYSTIFIDEAQRIPKIGWGLKILVDSLPELKIVASGSSSFELSNRLGEPLTGRQNVFMMYPVAMSEIAVSSGRMHVMQHLNEYLIYGSYPEVLNSVNTKQKQEYLLTLRNSYLFKDILELDNIRNSSKLIDLLKLIAFQIGNEVSLSELSISLGIAKQTVERYLDLLEKAFIIIKVRGYSSNLRKEVTKTARYYFVDNGIRNSVINNFNEPTTRMDMGMLWENFCFIERMKKKEYQQLFSNNYFWRTYDRQEVDLVEERNDLLYGFEFKWGRNKSKKVKAPTSWMTYSNASFECITPENFLEFVL